MPLVATHAQSDVSGLVLGLGFVLSFGYWCTDFVLMQRALASRTEAEARQVPLWAGFGKLAFSLIVVIPGLAASRVMPGLGHTQRFDQTLPLMMTLFYGPTFLGLGLTALAASLMSGLAANISGFAAIVTQDIYQSWLVKGREEAHYVHVGRLCTVAAAVASVAASFGSFLFSNLMEHVQLIFSLLAAPFWAVFLLGMTSRRATARGALWGLATGTSCAALHHLAVSRNLLHYGSTMNATFHGALYGFTAALAAGWCLRAPTPLQPRAEAAGLWFDWAAGWHGERIGLLLALSAVLLAACIAFNIAWW
jgi:SSS family solute:Na+ symporter